MVWTLLISCSLTVGLLPGDDQVQAFAVMLAAPMILPPMILPVPGFSASFVISLTVPTIGNGQSLWV